jgi:hypothetical protein
VIVSGPPPMIAPADGQHAAAATSAAADASTHRWPIEVPVGILKGRLKRRFTAQQGNARG